MAVMTNKEKALTNYASIILGTQEHKRIMLEY